MSNKKHIPHYKICKSCPFHVQFLSMDKMIENYTQKINECFDRSSIPNVALVPEDFKKELIENGSISPEYKNKPLIFRRK